MPIILDYRGRRYDGNLGEANLIDRRETLVASLHKFAYEKFIRLLTMEEVAVWFRGRDNLNTPAPDNNTRHTIDYQELMYAWLYPKEGTTERVDLDNGFQNAGCKLSSSSSVKPPLFHI